MLGELVGEPTTMVASGLRRRSDRADRPPVVPNVRRTVVEVPDDHGDDMVDVAGDGVHGLLFSAWFRRWWRCFSWGSSCSVFAGGGVKDPSSATSAACWGTRWSIAPSPTKGASSASPTVPIGAPTGRGWSGLAVEYSRRVVIALWPRWSPTLACIRSPGMVCRFGAHSSAG